MTLANTTLAIIISILTISNCLAFSDSSIYKVIALEREIMLQNDDKLSVNLLLQKSQIYQDNKQYDQAIKTLDRINLNDIDSAHSCAFYYLKTQNLFLNGSYNQSLYSLRSLEYSCPDGSVERNILKLAVLLENEQWKEFEAEYLKKVSIENNIDTIAFKSNFGTPEWSEPSKFKKMSALLPGLGLIKSGEERKGAINLSLNIASLGFAAYNFYYGFYATGIFSGLINLRRFYNGGKNLTIASVEDQNEVHIADMKYIGYVYLKKLYTR